MEEAQAGCSWHPRSGVPGDEVLAPEEMGSLPHLTGRCAEQGDWVQKLASSFSRPKSPHL